MMQEEDFRSLLEKYQKGTASAEEKAFVEGWYLFQRNTTEKKLTLHDKAASANYIWNALQPALRERTVFSLWPRIAAAVLVFVILGTGTYFLLNRQTAIKRDNDIAPYTGMAILKSGGKTILLDNAANGLISGTNVTKSIGESLSYKESGHKATTLYDTIEIPAGGRPYTIELSDGSKIAVNAATTFRYPKALSSTRKEALELISGEIYLDVVHRPGAPMKVIAPGQVITDLGTAFNIAAYKDEPESRTTLISGSVSVKALGEAKVLSPGRQTILESGKLSEGLANIPQTIAWKAGIFRFNGEQIDVIMRQLARWYNIQVTYDGKITDEVFYGVVDRRRNISEVLRILQLSGKVKFKIEGRRVTVSSKS